MSLMLPEKFQHILRIVGTNIDGKRKVMFAMTAIKGVGRRYANIVLKNADVNLDKRAGECSEEEFLIFDALFLIVTLLVIEKAINTVSTQNIQASVAWINHENRYNLENWLIFTITNY
ncbi:unnamed protein product [Nesidiocoris tenuis]|uniref:Small ribosomal subunit protein uS13 n=1 Tax=Nesidiocoris tenuis TaxID=355587 RepID=A0A6H5GIL9_9HEMI|nr:unnamed protein product [Nesidiocoris tenuis]